jgi:hypothetical protein
MGSNFNLELTIPDEVCPGSMIIRMAGTPDEPLFCLPDLCAILELGQAARVADRLDEDEVTKSNLIDSLGRSQPTWFVADSGLYTVLFRSSKPRAKPFRRWVTHDVLPSIQKHGCYPPPVAPPPQQQVLPAWSQRLSTSFMQHYAFINCHHPGFWSVLVAINTVCMALEDVLIRHCLPVKISDRPDGSVGQHYVAYRSSLRMPEPVYTAPLYLPDLRRSVDVNLYGPHERGIFDAWLVQEYIPEHCPQYLVGKYRRQFGILPPLSAADQASLELAGCPARLASKQRQQLSAAGGFVTATNLLAGPPGHRLTEILENN